MKLERLICYYDSRGQWLERVELPGLAPAAIRELSYLLPEDSDVIETFNEIATLLSRSGVRCELIEAWDSAALAAVLTTADKRSMFWNMTDGFHPVTASYFPAVAAMRRIPYFGNSAALQLAVQNKFFQYAICKSLGIPVPDTTFFDGAKPLGPLPYRPLSKDLFVKPFDLANSIGIYGDAVCSSMDAAIEVALRIKRSYGRKSLIQSYIKGKSVRVNYVAVQRDIPIHQSLGIHLIEFDSDVDEPFSTLDRHFDNFAKADALYAATAKASDVTADTADPELYQAAVSGIRADTEKLVCSLGLRDFFSMDYKLTDSGERYFIELNTLPFVRNPGLKAYCREQFGCVVGEALGTAILSASAENSQPDW
jgi:D-alanine-D-alanine ligase